jgi:hypothetical protein
MDGAGASHLYHAIDHATPSQAAAWAKRQQRLKRMVPVVPLVAPVIEVPPKPKAAPVLPALPAVKPIWFSIIESGPRRYYLQEIQLAVCEHFGISMLDLNGPRKMQQQTIPRTIAYYICKVLTGRSLPEIGRRFGNRDHTTVLHGVRKIEALLGKSDQATVNHINAIRKLLDEHQAPDSCGPVEDQAALTISQGGSSSRPDSSGASALDPAPRA